MEPLLTRKEVCALREINKTTLYRWERQGLKIVGGRIKESDLVWWLEQRDAAKRLGMEVHVFLAHDRAVREKLLAAAMLV